MEKKLKENGQWKNWLFGQFSLPSNRGGGIKGASWTKPRLTSCHRNVMRMEKYIIKIQDPTTPSFLKGSHLCFPKLNMRGRSMVFKYAEGHLVFLTCFLQMILWFSAGQIRKKCRWFLIRCSCMLKLLVNVLILRSRQLF